MRKISILTALFLFSLTALPGAEESPAIGDPVEDIGTFIDVGEGIRLQLTLVNKQIVGYFVDANSQLVETPAKSILFIVDDTTHRDDEWRTVLEPISPVKLTSPRRFYGPPDFRAKIIIRFTDGDASTFPTTPLELERNL